MKYILSFSFCKIRLLGMADLGKTIYSVPDYTKTFNNVSL